MARRERIVKEEWAVDRFYVGLAVVMLLCLPFFARAEESPSVSDEGTAIVNKVSPEGEKMPSEPAEETTVEGNDDTSRNEPESQEVAEEKGVADPLEPWNRIVFTFNDRFYFWVFKPLAKGYNFVIPEGARVLVRNFFSNITMPVRLVNSLLQGNMKSAGIEIARFGVNSTFGVGGLFDVAKVNYDLESQEKDLGLTLGHYGVGNGFYIIWPFLGPSSLRDTIGTVGDGFLTPVNYITPIEDVIAIQAYEYFNDGSLRIGEYEDFKESAIEPYIALRDAYIQHRKAQIEK